MVNTASYDWILKVLQSQIYALGKFNADSTPDPKIAEVLLETIKVYLSIMEGVASEIPQSRNTD